MHDPHLLQLPLSRRQALGVLATPFIIACFPDKLTGPRFDIGESGAPITLIGAGDPHAKLNNKAAIQTGKLIKAMLDQNPGSRAFALGDCTAFGTAEEFQLYHSAWGAFKDITDFQIGNHDLLSDSTGTAYYDYAGELAGPKGKGYYAKTYGTWRCYFLNSMRLLSEQTTWLAADLPNWSGYHIMAMWHHPLFASICVHSGKAMTPKPVGPWWQLLQDAGAEFVLVGHVHRYERFAKLLRNGTPSDQGLRQFIIGTGGAKPMEILSVHPQSEYQAVARGVFKVDLYEDRYEWWFTDLAGVIRDSGVELCRPILTPPVASG